MTFVLDASVALSWLLQDADAREASYAFAVLKALRTEEVAASVPMTWGLEIANVLARRYRLSSYDAFYLELALRAALPLTTLDEGLRRAAHRRVSNTSRPDERAASSPYPRPDEAHRQCGDLL